MLKVEVGDYRIVRAPFERWVVVHVPTQRIHLLGEMAPQRARELVVALLRERRERERQINRPAKSSQA